jgi:hypothetical protein
VKHNFTVNFYRELGDDVEVVQKTFPGRPLIEQLQAQLCAELDENPALRGTYTVTLASVQGSDERFTVHFAFEHPGKRAHAKAMFRHELQATYTFFGMAGSFEVRD